MTVYMIRIIELILGQSRAEFRIGSNSEVITLEALCTGDEWKAEPICCLISGVFSSQFGQERSFDINHYILLGHGI